MPRAEILERFSVRKCESDTCDAVMERDAHGDYVEHSAWSQHEELLVMLEGLIQDLLDVAGRRRVER